MKLHRLTLDNSIKGAAVLLDHMRQLVGQQCLPITACWSILPLSKENMLPYGECLCLHRSIQLIGLSICMRSHRTEIRAKRLLQRLADRFRQRLPSTAQLLNRGFDCRWCSHASSGTLKLKQ